MSRVVIAGRWDGGVPALPTGEALDAIRRGVLVGASDPVVVTVPCGTGPTFDEAVAALDSQASFVRVPTDASSSREAGERVADSLRNGSAVIVEGGHNSSPDCGVGFLEGLLGAPGIDPRQPEALADALTHAQALVSDAGVDLVCAASTARPLLGLDSVLAVAPDLEPIEAQDTALPIARLVVTSSWTEWTSTRRASVVPAPEAVSEPSSPPSAGASSPRVIYCRSYWAWKQLLTASTS